jgi:RNA polymerase sigma-70 factor (ECF subfamily)
MAPGADRDGFVAARHLTVVRGGSRVWAGPGRTAWLADDVAFSRFYRGHAQALLVYFTRRTYDVDSALDLTAETFAQAFAARHRFRGRSDAQADAWLFAIASSQLAAYLRRGYAQRRLLTRLGVQVPEASAPEIERVLDLAGLGSLRAVIAQELSRLSGEQRDALQLRVIDELPYADVASRLGISEQAARMRVSRGLSALARAVESAPPLIEESP